MTIRESWEIAHDDYYDTLEADDCDTQDEIEAYKREEQAVIDEVIRRLNK